MSENLTDERAKFEAWAVPEGFDCTKAGGGYITLGTLVAWSSWQASRVAASENTILVDKGALKMALNVLRRADKNEVADALELTAARAAVPAQGLTPDDARQLLCVRDYLDAGKWGDAIYALTAFADHEMNAINPWARIEALAKEKP